MYRLRGNELKHAVNGALEVRPREAELVIIGAGFGGLAAGIRAIQSGFKDVLLLERSGDVGGVWRDNSYPGCACDVQSHLYSLSFAPNPAWSHDYSKQPEIHGYLRRCAHDFGLTSRIHYHTEVQRLEWHEGSAQWLLQTNHGEYRARWVILAMGSLSDPLIPDIEGQERFAGLAFHSAQWPDNVDLQGKRVAVIGTGASAIQFIPAIQPIVKHMTVFQRTPAWVMPRHDGAIPSWQKRLYAKLPLLQKAARARIYVQREAMAFGFRHPPIMRLAQKAALKHLHAAIQDPELRSKLTPNYTLGCKRILLSNTYYPALAQSNVDVVTEGVRRITPAGIVDQQGVERPFDVIIYGAGFKVKDLPYSHFVHGNNGVTLAQAWGGSPKALAGTSVHGFPNLFLLHGPNVGLGHTSVIYMLEAQVEHAIDVIRKAKARSKTIVEARADAQRQFTDWLDRKMKGTVWTAGGCNSWYLDDTGRNSALWPTYTFAFRSRVVRARENEYQFRHAAQSTVSQPG